MKDIYHEKIHQGDSGKEYERFDESVQIVDNRTTAKTHVIQAECGNCTNLMGDPSTRRRCAICKKECCVFCSIQCSNCSRWICSDCVAASISGRVCSDCNSVLAVQQNFQNALMLEKTYFDRCMTILKFKLQSLYQQPPSNHPLLEKVKQLRISRVVKEIEQLENRYTRLIE